MAEDSVAQFPHFRHVDPAQADAPAKLAAKITLLTDADFAPWSFVAADGTVKGISVEMAQAACAESGLTCDIRPLPFSELLAAFRRNDGDAVISGLRMDEAVAAEGDLTRPYFTSLGRFLVRQGSPLTAPDIRTLAGRRLGYVKATAHGAFIENLYSRSALTPFDKPDAMLEALRTGTLDAVFGDSLYFSFWMKGSLARNCCVPLGKAFVDRHTFSRDLAVLTRRDERNLAGLFDHAFDVMEEKNTTAKIFSSYLPSPIW